MILTSRQKNILLAIVELYSKTAKPISSKELIEAYTLEYSPATLRSEMHNLEEAGLLKKPHTSAGRIPTDEGYRFYIKELIQKKELAKEEKRRIKVKVNQAKEEKDFSKELAEVLADFSEVLALVGRVEDSHFHFAGLEELFDQIDREMSSSIIHFLEEAERNFEDFFGEDMSEPSIFIGHDHPLLRSSKCGLILSPFRRGKEKGVLALLGPDRMNYERNLAIVNYINNLLD